MLDVSLNSIDKYGNRGNHIIADGNSDDLFSPGAENMSGRGRIGMMLAQGRVGAGYEQCWGGQ